MCETICTSVWGPASSEIYGGASVPDGPLYPDGKEDPGDRMTRRTDTERTTKMGIKASVSLYSLQYQYLQGKMNLEDLIK